MFIFFMVILPLYGREQWTFAGTNKNKNKNNNSKGKKD